MNLDDLDRYGEPRYADDPADPTRRVYSDTVPDNVAEMTDEEKDAATPPTAGVQIGVPSYISVPGTLIGGAAMLIHVLSELF